MYKFYMSGRFLVRTDQAGHTDIFSRHGWKGGEVVLGELAQVLHDEAVNLVMLICSCEAKVAELKLVEANMTEKSVHIVGLLNLATTEKT